MTEMAASVQLFNSPPATHKCTRSH